MEELTDIYYTVEEEASGLFKDRGSKFIARVFPVISEDDVKYRLEELRKEYYDARHHCYAYRLGPDKLTYRINDDGEPSGSAGRPIFGQIQSNDLTNILIVVIRYFGGVKLGVPGLINAYKQASIDALNHLIIKKKYIYDHYSIDFEYPEMNNVMRVIKEEKLEIIDQKFELNCNLTFTVRKSFSHKVYTRLLKNRKIKVNYLQSS